MDKMEYIIQQIGKTNKKKYENYVVTRIWNLLNSLDYKFVTQQYVVRPEGYALTDMYFPQVKLHIEIKEPYHIKIELKDRDRERDIVTATDHDVFSIEIMGGIENIHQQIDDVVKEIRSKREELGNTFIPWDIDSEYNPQTYIDKGCISLVDNVAFHRIVDTCRCFGLNYKGFQRGGATHPKEKDTLIWFPKLYPNDEWDNELTRDGLYIYEKNRDTKIAEKHYQKVLADNQKRRIVFARGKDNLGSILYRFKGVFALDVEETNKRKYLVWKKISDEAKTYQ
ncbi:hypothetical protein JR334_07735 [Clostridia bacterium]|nr:hypothetical protein JR334_07735 [Clostridia bacterium]